MPKLGPRKMPFGMKHRAQQAAIASHRAGRESQTFMTPAARTSSELLSEVGAIFPVGSKWVMHFTYDHFVVERITTTGEVVMNGERGMTIVILPWVAKRAAWERVA